MASGGNDRDAEDALLKLLQMGTVVEYHSRSYVIYLSKEGVHLLGTLSYPPSTLDHLSERKEPVDEAVFVNVNDETKGFSLAESIKKNNTFDATSSDQSTAGLEANKVVNDADGEVKMLNWVQQTIDVESTSDNDA
ncbi:hypothetical protein Tco_0735673 [Tanacetum coccineum]